MQVPAGTRKPSKLLMASLLALGLYRRAADLRSKVDFASWAKSPGFDGRLVDIREWSARESATATASARWATKATTPAMMTRARTLWISAWNAVSRRQRRWPMPGRRWPSIAASCQ